MCCPIPCRPIFVPFVPLVIFGGLQRRENIGLIDLTPSFEPHRLHHLKKLKNLPSKTANCYQVLLPALHFPLAFKHESFTLCQENRYGALHAHRTHQRQRRKVPLRQCAVLENSSSDSNRGSNLLPPPEQRR